MPLPRAILDDPAFSPDPRAHPHFPLANALSFKALPSKSPLTPDGLPSSPSVSSLSESILSPPPTVSSATSLSSLRSPTPSPPPPPSKPPPPQPTLLVPHKPPSALSRARQALKPVSTNILPKSRTRMKALVRRLTTRHDLDRIDELDETDPFGASYHHDGPYEAISSNLAQSTLRSTHSNPPPRRNNVQYPIRQSDPLPSRPSYHHSDARVSFAYGETGLSLHLEPGQILQQNTIYTSRASSMTAFPPQFHSQPNTFSFTTRPARRQSLPIPHTLPTPDPSSLGVQGGFQTHKSFSLRAPRERYLGEYTPDISNNPPINHDHDMASYVHHQPEKTVLPPPRCESIMHNLGPPRSPQHTPPPPSNTTAPKTQSTQGVLPTSPFPTSRHKSAHSLDSSHTAVNSTFTPSLSSVQSKPLDPPRIRHLPKRLVMPAPLQPQPQAPQPQYKFPPVEPSLWREGHPDHHTLESAHFEGKPAKYSQEPRLLRKKSSAFPPKAPIPNIVPMSQDDAVSILGNPPGKTVNEAEGTKERTRRRRLSKRKGDI